MKRNTNGIVGAARRAPLGAQSPLLRSLHLSDVEVLDLGPVKAEDDPKVANAKLAQMYAAIQDLVRNKKASTDELAKIAEQVKLFQAANAKHAEIAAKAEQALELARAAASTVPDRAASGDEKGVLRTLVHGLEPDDDLLKLAKVPSINPHYYALVSQTHADVKEKGAPESLQAQLAEFRLLNDCLYILGKVYGLTDPSGFAEAGGLRSLKLWPRFQQLGKRWREALAGQEEATDALGGAWVPTLYSGNLVSLVQIMTRLMAFFEMIPMPSLTYTLPVEGSDLEAYFIAEGADITEGTFGTEKVSLTARKLAGRARVTRELDQDSIIGIVSHVNYKLAKAQVRGEEKIGVNGQRTSVIDTGEVIGATDARNIANGIRWAFQQMGLAPVDGGTGLTIEMMAKARGPMGPYGVDPSVMLWLCSAWGSAHILTVKNAAGDLVAMMPGIFGAGAAARTGVLGEILGSPIVVSPYAPDNLNASGIIDGAGDRTAIWYPNTEMFKKGNRLGITLDASTHVYWTQDQIGFKAVRRLDFTTTKTAAAADPFVNAIGNLLLA